MTAPLLGEPYETRKSDFAKGKSVKGRLANTSPPFGHLSSRRGLQSNAINTIENPQVRGRGLGEGDKRAQQPTVARSALPPQRFLVLLYVQKYINNKLQKLLSKIIFVPLNNNLSLYLYAKRISP